MRGKTDTPLDAKLKLAPNRNEVSQFLQSIIPSLKAGFSCFLFFTTRNKVRKREDKDTNTSK